MRYGLASQVGVGQASRTARLSEPDEQGRVHLEIRFGFKEGAANPPCPGFRGRLLTASPWNYKIRTARSAG